jgi:hypothetical protein
MRSILLYLSKKFLLTWAELSSVIKEHAPGAIKLGEIKNHFGRKVAIVSYDAQ